MFPGKYYHCIIKCKYIIHASLPGTFPFIMYNCRLREVYVSVSCLNQTVRDINILSVHKEVFIKKTNLVNCCFPEHHKSSRKHFNIMNLILIEISQVVPRKYPGFWEKP